MSQTFCFLSLYHFDFDHIYSINGVYRGNITILQRNLMAFLIDDGEAVKKVNKIC